MSVRVAHLVDEWRPTVAELQGDHHFARLALGSWLGDSKGSLVEDEFIKTKIWDTLVSEGFSYRSLLVLENLRLLESLLWPKFSEDSSDDHILLITIISNVKSREGLPVWDVFTASPDPFPLFFRRVLSMVIDTSISLKLRSHLLSFIALAFQSLDSIVVRKECAPLVSISIWHNLQNDQARERLLVHAPQWRKNWRASNKRYEAGDEEIKQRLRYERSWLFALIVNFLSQVSAEESSDDSVRYCETFIDLLVNLESQLPTRRYVNVLLLDINLLPIIRLSKLYNDEDNVLIRDLYTLLRHFIYFPVDESTGAELSQNESYEKHCAVLATLQRTALKYFKEKLTILALSNYGAINKRSELEGHLAPLTDQELLDLTGILGFRAHYPESSGITVDRRLLMELLLTHHEQRPSFQNSIQRLSILPTETSLFEPMMLRNERYNGSTPLAIPKLNLQYLTTGDFLWRSFILHRLEAFFGIRKDIEDVLKRLQVRFTAPGQPLRFDGFSKMALESSSPGILEAAEPLVGEEVPAFVRAEITVDISSLNNGVRGEWDALKPDDVIFLLHVTAPVTAEQRMNGSRGLSDAEAAGLKSLRAAEVVQVLEENGRKVQGARGDALDEDGYRVKPRKRRILINLDPVAYKADMDRVGQGKANVYKSINLVVRRKGRENNFKQTLSSIRSLTLSDVPITSWLQEVFLGYGNPAGASYPHLPKKVHSLDFRDTFLEWNHLVQSFPGRVIEPREEVDSSFPPPYVLDFPQPAEAETSQPSRKRRRGQADAPVATKQVEKVQVSTYSPPNNGPYPTDAPKLNGIRFTPAQVQAIVSGTQPGLSVIVGPPGTGKTDVAVQIINNLYHDFPHQRTLLVAHSNQALNQLFQKIIALDIDERHLLRLGHGEEDLGSNEDYSKHGRVESFLRNRSKFLREVDRLAANFGVHGAHGNSCETAGYFNSVYVRPAWTQFTRILEAEDATIDEIKDAFPFYFYFSNAPQPLFPDNVTREQAATIAQGCYRHISKIFAELEDIRPFELLRSQRDKSNYLLVKEARIVAMTATHAAIRRQEIAQLGFRYHNLVMEEAAQVTEIETFIPLALQNVKDGELPLERVILCGDHQQNSPIISNLAFRKFANLEQSMFLRFVRLGVPVINLDQQGRARPSIANLYNWRYQNLGNLPLVESEPEFQTANAGLAHDFQFIDVPDYKGVGEAEPTPHWIHNLGEAEYVVALYQYMRLLGYPAAKISILTPYAGQRALITDVLNHRCAKNRIFGLPKIVVTVDRYQGEQNDYILLSLTRSAKVGYLRDIRRMTVALSRARLGLYIFGRRAVFEACFELREAFERLLERPDKLQLVTGEMFPTARAVKDSIPETVQMEGVEHLGAYVFEMTQAKVEALKKGKVPAQIENGTGTDEIMDDTLQEEL
ncbi:MAG: hypothetical protein M1814_005109 [Vezdaea aestivalis]|nr:MAG: hypothetical protein M1814_005109 [Vezdaea aestivalis]